MNSPTQCSRFALCVIVCTLISVIPAASVHAQLPSVALRTVYLSDPIGRAHVITVRGELGGEGEVVLDGNTCTVTQFGDAGICTEIAFRPIPVKLVQLRLADPTGAGRRLFQLQGELSPPDTAYYLVVPRKRSDGHRLVVNLPQVRRRVVTMESIIAPSLKPELCQNAKYQAFQGRGKVTVVGKGEHPTAGWKVAFEQLPINIFPPQFRLVCFKPQSAVAQVVTPFKTIVSFASDAPVKQVFVHDANGQHKVPVEQE